MSLHLFAVAAANLPLPDVIKGCRSSEWQRKRRRRRRWRRRPFFSLSSSSVWRPGDTHSRLNTVQTQPEWANAWCRDSHQETLCRRIKKLFYQHHLARHLRTLLESERGVWLFPTQRVPTEAEPKRKTVWVPLRGPLDGLGRISKASNDRMMKTKCEGKLKCSCGSEWEADHSRSVTGRSVKPALSELQPPVW